MNETQINKRLAILMCVIFATHLAALLYGMYAGAIMYDLGAKIFNVGNIILELPIIICAFLIASEKKLFRTPEARIASWVFFGFQSFNLFNMLYYCIWDNNIFGIVGPSAHIIWPVVFAGSSIWFYVSLKMWSPVKISSIISALPPIVSGILLYQVVGKDYADDLLPIFNAIGTTVLISAILYAITLILSIIWALKKPLAPHVQSNPIDLI